MRSKSALITKVPINQLSDGDIDRLVDLGYGYARQVRDARGNKPRPLDCKETRKGGVHGSS